MAFSTKGNFFVKLPCYFNDYTVEEKIVDSPVVRSFILECRSVDQKVSASRIEYREGETSAKAAFEKSISDETAAGNTIVKSIFNSREVADLKFDDEKKCGFKRYIRAHSDNVLLLVEAKVNCAKLENMAKQFFDSFVLNVKSLGDGLSCVELDNKVKNLIDDFTVRLKQPNKSVPFWMDYYEDKQDRIFYELEITGPRAVPFIIKYLDDRRPLHYPRMKLDNRAVNAFEAWRHYGPVKVVDALAAILNQMTGRSFGFIYNGRNVSEAERDQEVAGWRNYLKEELAKGTYDCRP